MISRRQFMKGLGAAVLTLMAPPAYAIGIEPFRLRVQRYHLTPPHWPKDMKLTAALIADPHVCDPWMGLDRLRFIVERTNALKPDIILMLGDYVAGHPFSTGSIPVQAWADVFAGLTAPLGTHAVLGNHDWWDDRTAQLAGSGVPIAGKALIKAGIELYQNRAVRLKKDGRAFWLAGLDDQIALIPNKKANRKRWQGADDLGGTLAQVTDDAPVLLMAHEPGIIREVPARVSLTMSGHTHGGQINLFGYKPVSGTVLGKDNDYGHILYRGRPSKNPELELGSQPKHLMISGGLGCSILPVRFGVPPEITVVHLGDGKNAAAV